MCRLLAVWLPGLHVVTELGGKFCREQQSKAGDCEIVVPLEARVVYFRFFSGGVAQNCLVLKECPKGRVLNTCSFGNIPEIMIRGLETITVRLGSAH